MSLIEITITVDPETEMVNIQGEHAALFLSIWENMKKQAKAEALAEAVGVCEDIWHVEAITKLKAKYD